MILRAHCHGSRLRTNWPFILRQPAMLVYIIIYVMLVSYEVSMHAGLQGLAIQYGLLMEHHTGYKVQTRSWVGSNVGGSCVHAITNYFCLYACSVVAPKAVKHLRGINNGGITSGEWSALSRTGVHSSAFLHSLGLIVPPMQLTFMFWVSRLTCFPCSH